jgi:hypothetical protein
VAFYKRVLRVVLVKRTINSDNLTGDEVDQIQLDGLRVIVQAHQQQGAFGTAEIQVYGMTPSQMAFFTYVQDGSKAYSNTIIQASVLAQDWRGIFSLIYVGTVIDAQPELNQAPDVGFNVVCSSAADQGLLLIPPKSYNGSEDAASVFNVLASQAGYGFQNGGVTTVLNNLYLSGTWMDQYQALVRAAGCNAFVSNNTLMIWPPGGSLADTTSVIAVSPDTGLIGYPRRRQTQMMCDIEFQPSIQPGAHILLYGLNDPAGLTNNCLGEWVIYEILHTMGSEAPGAPWMISLVCNPYNASAT